MRALTELNAGVEDISYRIRRYGANVAAERLLQVSDLLKHQGVNQPLLDFIPRLLDPKPVQQEIEAAAIRKVERWNIVQTVSIPLLLIFTFLTILFAIFTYLGLWPINWHNTIPTLLSLGILLDFTFFSLWVLSLWRIQWSKRRVERICTEISRDLQGVVSQLLLTEAQHTYRPRSVEEAVRFVAENIEKTMKGLAELSGDTLQQLARTNQQTVSALQQITPGLFSFQEDITNFRNTINDYTQELIRANVNLNSTLQQIAATSKDQLTVELDLERQITMLNNIQQASVTRTEAIATSMSATAQSIIHIADQLTNQPQSLSVRSDGDVVLNISNTERQRDFDIFLCHNSKDKPAVRDIAEQLKKRGIKPWLDEWEIAPGMPWQSVLEKQIARIRAVAVFLSQDDLGPWQNLEVRTLLQEFVERGCPIIPVILPGYDGTNPDLPPFLRSMTWVDFRQKEPDPLARLIWGVTGGR